MTSIKTLENHAHQAMEKAYAPYSNFSVGVALVDENHAIHLGCNVENSAYPEGLCAEAGAIANMVLSGGKKIHKILIVSSGELMVTPCGGCRQKIKEFSDHNTQILISHNNKITAFTMNELLPHSFDKLHLP